MAKRRLLFLDQYIELGFPPHEFLKKTYIEHLFPSVIWIYDITKRYAKSYFASKSNDRYTRKLLLLPQVVICFKIMLSNV